MHQRKTAICFVDDDPEEIRRFRENLNDVFDIGAGTSVDEALADLRKQNRPRPDLYLLDLYFPEGRKSSEDELRELALARERFLIAQAEFQSKLSSLRQSTRGGLSLAKELPRILLRRAGFAFFTRKATFEDAIDALGYGAVAVIKKPDPSISEIQAGSLPEAYDLAFKNNAADVVREIRRAIRRSNWWWKHREAIATFFLGVVASLVAGYLLHVLFKN